MQLWLPEDPAMTEGNHVYCSGQLIAVAETVGAAEAIARRWNAIREAWLACMCPGLLRPTPEDFESGRVRAVAILSAAMDT